MNGPAGSAESWSGNRGFLFAAAGAAIILGSVSLLGEAAPPPAAGATGGNKPERLEWLQDAGFGMFIHIIFPI